MNRLLLRKEWLALARDGRLRVLACALLALFIAVFVVSDQEQRQAQQEKQQAEAAARAQWDTQGDKHPHRGAHFGLYVFAPDSPLASFDPGVSRHLGQALWLEPHKRNMVRYSEAADDPVSGRFNEFTPAFVLTAILPLLIVAVVFGAVAQERENGTLRMLRALAMHEQHFVWSKFLVLFGTVSAVVIAVFGIALLPSTFAHGGVGMLLRGAMLCAAFLLYCAVFIALGLTVSAFARNSRKAFVVLAALWLVFVFIVPRAGAAITAEVVALPSADQFWRAIRRDYEHGLPGEGSLAERSKRFDAALLRKYSVQRLEDLPVGGYALRRLHRDAYADKVHALHFDDLWRRYREQETVLRGTALFSPAVAMRLISMKLAGTDLAHRQHFEDAAEVYRRDVNTHIDEWDVAHSHGLRSFDDKYGSNAVWQSIEPFRYRIPSPAFALRLVLPELTILLGWLLLSALLLVVAGRRMKT